MDGDTVAGYIGSQTRAGRGGYDERCRQSGCTGGRGLAGALVLALCEALQQTNAGDESLTLEVRDSNARRHPRSMPRSALSRSGCGQTTIYIRKRMRASSERSCCMKILSVESSCDETAVAIVRGRTRQS